jgi:hypothetical protein
MHAVTSLLFYIQHVSVPTAPSSETTELSEDNPQTARHFTALISRYPHQTQFVLKTYLCGMWFKLSIGDSEKFTTLRQVDT